MKAILLLLSLALMHQIQFTHALNIEETSSLAELQATKGVDFRDSEVVGGMAHQMRQMKANNKPNRPNKRPNKRPNNKQQQQQMQQNSSSRTKTITPSDNASIRFGRSDRNYADAESLFVDGRPFVDALIGFDLGTIDTSSGGKVSSAKLELYSLTSSDGGETSSGGGINFNVVLGKEWNEHKVTWDSAPVVPGPKRTQVQYDRSIDRNEWIVVDVTDGVNWSLQQQQNKGMVTFRMDTKKGEIEFASKEFKGFAPRLVLQYNEDGSNNNSNNNNSSNNSNNNNSNNNNSNNNNSNNNNSNNNNSNNNNSNNNNSNNNNSNNSNSNNNNSSNNDSSRPNNKPRPDKPQKKPAKKPNKEDKPDNNAANKPSSTLDIPPKDKPANNNSNNNDSTSDSTPASTPSASKNDYTSSSTSAKEAFALLSKKESTINNKLFLFESPSDGWIPSSVYNYDGLKKGLEVMNSKGVSGMVYYLGNGGKRGWEYGLVNVAGEPRILYFVQFVLCT
jgi:hypothetical protein